jgi:uncharacterized membrane-anchored protein YjiN (DUF445 family)
MMNDELPIFPRMEHRPPANWMRRLETGMLVTMLGILVLANMFLSAHPLIGYVRAFAEAAVVGALADWFAVTALFRQPLRLPIPHPPIVPRNKDRIGQSLGRFVEQNFASPTIISMKLANADLSGKLAGWLSDPEQIDALAGHGTRLIPQLLNSLDDRYLQRLVSGDVQEQAQRINMSPLLPEAVLANCGETAPSVARQAAARSGRVRNGKRAKIRQRIHEKTTDCGSALYGRQGSRWSSDSAVGGSGGDQSRTNPPAAPQARKGSQRPGLVEGTMLSWPG